MATISVSDTAYQQADNFLAAFLSENVPEGDFSVGSALRDLAIRSIALVYALLEQERQTVAANSSLLKLAKATPGPDVDAAVDAYLSNLFITRKTGSNATVVALLHFSQRTSVTLTPAVRFYRTTDLLFTPDVTGTVVLSGDSMQQNFYADGTSDYTLPVTLVAVNPGTAYNVRPGKFYSWDALPFLTSVEHLDAGASGAGVESTPDLLKRAPAALSTRNLINNRSINAAILEQFNSLTRVVAVGMGEPEMVRDVAVAGATQVHVGGHTDLFLALPRTTVVESGDTMVAGGAFTRPDGRAVVIKAGAGSSFLGAQVGQVVNILSGFPRVPRRYKIVRATPTELEVDLPFLAGGVDVTLSVGTLAPNFNDVLDARVGRTSDAVSEPGAVLLTGQPVYAVKKVEVLSGGTWIALTTRVNGTNPNAGEFSVVVRNPFQGQSEKSLTLVYVPMAYNGLPVRVSYDTVSGYQAVQDFINGAFERIIASNMLARALNPIYVSTVVAYTLRSGALSTYASADLSSHIANYINSFDSADTLSASDIIADLKASFPDVGIVSPLTLNYVLYTPDGQRIDFTSSDTATIHGAAQNLVLGDLTSFLSCLGVTDRVCRYIADPADIVCYNKTTETAPPAATPSYTTVNAALISPASMSSLNAAA